MVSNNTLNKIAYNINSNGRWAGILALFRMFISVFVRHRGLAEDLCFSSAVGGFKTEIISLDRCLKAADLSFHP